MPLLLLPPSDADLAALCAAIYKPTAPIEFDHFDAGLDDGVCWAIKKVPGFDIVVFRGSVTALDWINDLRAVAILTRVGHVHEGFFEGIEHVWRDLRPLLMQPAIITGHSLGAARAAVLTALMVADKCAPHSRVVFGEPKPGLLDFAKIVEPVPARSYRNGDQLHHDLVTDVPFSIPPLQYMHPTPIIPVHAEPTGDMFSRLGAFAYHHVELYEAALKAMPVQQAA